MPGPAKPRASSATPIAANPSMLTPVPNEIAWRAGDCAASRLSWASTPMPRNSIAARRGGAISPFDFTDQAVTLRPGNPWIRVTSGNAYGDGSRFFEGLAAMIGGTTLNALMQQFWLREKSQPSTTARLEEFLVRRTGDARIVDAFHRFAYGLPDATPAADLWLKDDPAHAGPDAWGGRFWNSPDLRVRNADDGGTAHQPPEYGQDNFFYARIRNRSTTTVARHCVVTFAVKPWAGTEFSFPGDWLPALAAVAAFDIGPGEERIVKARWPRAAVPPGGTHVCWLASVLSRGDSPAAGTRTWQSNALAQKNLTVVDLAPNRWWTLPFVAGAWFGGRRRPLHLELVRPPGQERLEAMLVQRSGLAFDPRARVPVPGAFAAALVARPPVIPGQPVDPDASDDGTEPFDSDRRPLEMPAAVGLTFAPGARSVLRMTGARNGQLALGLALRVPPDARPGDVLSFDLLAREGNDGRVVGGLSVQVRVVAPADLDDEAGRDRGFATLAV